MFIDGYPMATHPEPLRCKGFRVFFFFFFLNWLPKWLPFVILKRRNSLRPKGLRNLSS